MKEFNTAGRRAAPSIIEGAEPVEFVVDGETFTAYPPSAGQMALLISAQAERRDMTESIAAIIDFLDGLLDRHGQDRFRERLLDRDDPFDFDDVNTIVESLIEEWSGRPTTAPSASSSSRKNGGQRSMGRARSGAVPTS